MKIKCLKDLRFEIVEQEYDIEEYDIDLDVLNLVYATDSNVNLLLKTNVNRDNLPAEQKNIVTFNRVNELYDAVFATIWENSSCSFMIENIISPSRDELLKKCYVKD